MRYTQLRAFHHVASQGGFSRAAEYLNQSQPSLSEQVRQLERDYDFLLFIRRNRKVELTEAGERLLELTRQYFEGEETIGEYLDQSRHALSGTIRIMVDSPAHVSEILHRFRNRHPKSVSSSNRSYLNHYRCHPRHFSVLDFSVGKPS